MDYLLDELHQLRQIELAGKLTEEQRSRYVEIVQICHRNSIEIPFGIEL